MASVFGWYGFSLEHPSDWAPATLTGHRQEGYARLASPESVSGQIRWKTSRSATDMAQILDGYLAKLSQDAKRQKVRFSSHREERDGRIDYEWTGKGQGRGSLIYSEVCARAFFIEASATNHRSVQSTHRQLVGAFATQSDETSELWAAFGLQVRIPAGLTVTKQLFQSGRTRLEWKGRPGTIVAERWGFGEQILARHTFQEWAVNAMAMPKAQIDEEEPGLRLLESSLLRRTEGVAQFQRERNQLVTLTVQSKDPTWRPAWDWLI